MKKWIAIFTMVAVSGGMFACQNKGSEFEDPDHTVATDPEDYERGMRKEEVYQEKKEPLVEEEPEQEDK